MPMTAGGKGPQDGGGATSAGLTSDLLPAMMGTVPVSDRTARLRLLAASFLLLFVELALIRWTASNIVHLAYLTNFVLLASFLGIGVGFLRAGARRSLFPLALVALALLVGFVLAFPVAVTNLTGPGHLAGRPGLPLLPRWASLSVVFLLVVLITAAIGEAAARAFAAFPALQAYRLDVLGSLGGIVAFSALSFLGLPPVSWGLVAAGGLLVLLGRDRRWWHWAAALVLVGLLGAQSLSPANHWSPYYKVTTAPAPSRYGGTLAIWANNVPHQTIYPVARLHSVMPFYFFPYRHLRTPSPGDVLVVGAGNGNDVAVALSQGAERVDAVEIDPVLYRIGRDHHPDRPYQDPRVSVHINDGRAFLQGTGRRYDLVVFALPDSLTVLAGQSSLRLENYLFTVEAMRAARQHLRPGGTFSMYNYYEPQLLARYAGMLTSVYGGPPCVELGQVLGQRQQAVLTIGADGQPHACPTSWRIGAAPEPATDDHPFPYLSGRSIPPFYQVTLVLVLAVSLLVTRIAAGSLQGISRYLDLWCMGAAFLLLETKNVVQFALLFGTTWFVNAAVFAGILLCVLAAVETARRVRLPAPPLLYGALAVGLVVAWAVPQEALLQLAPPLRFVAAVALAFAPVFVANLVFAQRFAQAASSTVAFGANLLGAMVGGVLEYLALVAGYRFLLLVVALLYGLALAFGRRHLRPAVRG